MRHKKLLIGFASCIAVLLAFRALAPSAEKPYCTVLRSREGALLGVKIASDGQWRFAPADSVPHKLKTCIVYFEDEYFYYHPGFNPVSTCRALFQNMRAGEVRSGGSTITMQLVRMLSGNPRRTYLNKLIEHGLALGLELRFSKEQLLSLYISNAPCGGNVVGVETAAWKYFGKSVSALSWAESAMLAVLPNAPALIYPGKNAAKLRVKRDFLLRKLRDEKVLDQRAYELAIAEEIPQVNLAFPQLAGHLLERIARTHPDGGNENTTLQAGLQAKADEVLNQHVYSISAMDVHNACALIVDNQTRQVLAYVGNARAAPAMHENWVDMVTAHRSSGSILKPLLYGCMVDEGLMLPKSLIEDAPVSFGSFSPRNFNPGYDGLVPADEALARSLNVPAVHMLKMYGVPRFHRRLQQFGFRNFTKPASHYGLSLILGGGEVSCWELASAYSAMAFKLTQNRDPRKPMRYKLNSDAGDQSQVSYLPSSLAIAQTFSALTQLARPDDYVTSFRFQNRSIAWKTGTSFGFRDAWAVGSDARYTVAVWVGNSDGEGRPGLTGTGAAGPLLFKLFALLDASPFPKLPEGQGITVQVCARSGYKASNLCPERRSTVVTKAAAQSQTCPFHVQVFLDSTERYRVNGACYPVNAMHLATWFIVGPLEEFYYKQRDAFYEPLPPLLLCEANNVRDFFLVYPRSGCKVYVPIDESGTRSKCIFSVKHKSEQSTVFWHMDGKFLGTTHSIHQLAVTPPKGRHRLEVLDETGGQASCEFEVVTEQ